MYIYNLLKVEEGFLHSNTTAASSETLAGPFLLGRMTVQLSLKFPPHSSPAPSDLTGSK